MKEATHTRIYYEGIPHELIAFIRLKNLPDWAVDVQKVIRFWLGDDDALHAKTSGSTGIPKMIVLSREMLTSSAQATLKVLGVQSGDAALLFIPAKYIGGKMLIIRALIGEMDIHLLEPKGELPSLSKEYELVSLTPMQAANSSDQLDRFKTILLGGAPISHELEIRLQDCTAQIFHTYGMTETASHVALKRINGKQAQNHFEALPGMSFSTDDRDCLVIHAPALGIDSLTTNDVVELLSESSFIWKGRADHAVNSGGIKLFPEEIESQLEPHIDLPFFITGLPDAKLGERLVLVVESQEEISINLDVLQGPQKPKAIYLLPKFVYTETGKVKRKETKSLLES